MLSSRGRLVVALTVESAAISAAHDEVVARAANLIISRAAYETARSLFPDDRIDYRNGARIIARSDE